MSSLTNVLISFFSFILHPTAISFHWSIYYYWVFANLSIDNIPFSFNLSYIPYIFKSFNFSTNLFSTLLLFYYYLFILTPCFSNFSLCWFDFYCTSFLVKSVFAVFLKDDLDDWFISFSFFFWVTYDLSKDSFYYSFDVYSFKIVVSFSFTFLIGNDILIAFV